jgi:hypothetical protein
MRSESRLRLGYCESALVGHSRDHSPFIFSVLMAEERYALVVQIQLPGAPPNGLPCRALRVPIAGLIRPPSGVGVSALWYGES